MSFIQIIEITSSKLDEMRALDEQWEKATEGKRTARRSIVTRDRNDPNQVRMIVFFDSYESAMENSNLPETQEFAARWAQLTEEPIRFLDLDVIDDRTS
jgi:quinol monooxygenase YgiN